MGFPESRVMSALERSLLHGPALEQRALHGCSAAISRFVGSFP